MLPPIDVLQKKAGTQLSGSLKAGITSDNLPFVEYNSITFYRFPLDADRHNSKVGVNLGVTDYGFEDCLVSSICQILKDISFRFNAKRGVVPHMHCSIEPGDVVVEVGAYLGYYSMYFCNQVRPEGHVYAIEFQPDCFSVLERNLEYNFPENATAIHKGAWNEGGQRKAFFHKNQANSFRSDVLLKACHAPMDDFLESWVETDTLENIFSQQKISKIKLLTIQVNGAEVEVLEGLGKYFDLVDNIFVAAPYGKDGGNNVESVIKQINDRNFHIRIEGKTGIFGHRMEKGTQHEE